MKHQRLTHYLLIAVLLLFVMVAAVGDSNFTNVVASGDVTAGDDLTVTDDLAVGGNLAITGTSTLTGATTVTGASTHTGASTFSAGITQAVSNGAENLGMLPTVIKTTVPYTEATYTVATVGANEVWLIHDVFVNATADFDCTGDDCTFLVGDGNDSDGYCVLADAELQAADVDGPTGATAGYQCFLVATHGVYLDEATTNSYNRFIVTGADTIDAFVIETTGATGSAGSADVYVVYTRLE